MSAQNPIAVTSKVNLVDLDDHDVPELARFVAAQSGRAVAETLPHLNWLLLQNPFCHADGRLPLGCGLRSSDGELVGCILYLPQMFVFARTPLLVLGSSCFYVDESHRGSGGALFLNFTHAANQYLMFGNSANAIAAQLWKARGAIPIPNSAHELLGVMHWPPVIEELAARGGVPKSVASAAGAAAFWWRYIGKLELRLDKESELVRLTSPEEVMELPLSEPSNYLTAQRTEPYIRWRYFSDRDSSLALFALRSRRTQKQILVTLNERPRGHRGQIRSVCLLDVFPKPTPDALEAIIAALTETYRGRVDMIVLRNLDTECQEKMLSAGFQRRSFESPNGWLLDRKRLLTASNYYFVPADGDWII